jgi:hypothetical protein
MSITKPGAVFGRSHEWQDLARFVSDPVPGIRIGVVRGRRRHGKSFLLEHLCDAVGGVYTLALRQSRAMALARFSDSLAAALGYRLGAFADWVEALDTAVDALSRRPNTAPPLLVLDEFPYLADHSPELPSAIQALYDQRGPRKGHPPFKLILCGSALSVMSTLLAGDQALRGRAVLDLRVGPFGFRDAAEYWTAAPATALLVDAVLGGAPGYRDVVGDPPEPGDEGLFRWLERSILSPSHILFTEPDYLLAEDPRIRDRAIYHAIWQSVSAGASSPTQIGGLVGVDAKALTYHLNVMRDGGFVHYGQDLLLQRRPVITVADPAVRFHNLIVQPNLVDLELRQARTAWERSRKTFSDKILGPHFEELARVWLRSHGPEAGFDDVGQVGSTEVACREHRGHEVDVVAISRTATARAKGGRITVLGEARCTNKVRTAGDLRRLEHIRELLAAGGWDTTDTRYALFSRTGFSSDLKESAGDRRTRLLDLEAMYGVRSPSVS